MNNRNYPLLIAGIICLLTALLHTIGGQIDLISPLIDSELTTQTKTELLGVWHMITVLLFVFAYILLRNGIHLSQKASVELIAILFIFFGLVFILVSFTQGTLAPQWILCLPIGGLSWWGLKRYRSTTT